MPLYNDSLKPKLEQFKAILDALLDEKKYQGKQSADYSKKMIQKLSNFVDYLLKFNDPDFFIKNKDKIKAEFDFIDNNQETFVPTIFNQQSLDLAVCLRDFLKEVDADKDIDGGAGLKAALSLTSQTPKKWLENYLKNLDLSIRLYQDIRLTREVHLVKQNDLQDQMHDGFKKIKVKLNEYLRTKIDEKYSEFLKAYESFVNDSKRQMEDLPYVCIFSHERYTNSDNPYFLDPNDVFSRGPRPTIILSLLQYENDLNEKLSFDKKLRVVNEWLSQTNDDKACDAAQKQFEVFMASIKGRVEKYKKGDHLRFWQSVDTGKVAILDELTTTLDQINVGDGYRNIDAFKSILRAHQAHLNYLNGRKIANGECGSLICDAIYETLAMFYEISEVNDPRLQKQLNHAQRNVAPASTVPVATTLPVPTMK